jgi:hypothetical protein
MGELFVCSMLEERVMNMKLEANITRVFQEFHSLVWLSV